MDGVAWGKGESFCFVALKVFMVRQSAIRDNMVGMMVLVETNS